MAIRYGERVEFEGAVLYEGERNWPDDSDFYAVVWTGTHLRTVEYASTRYGGGGSCTVDATDAVKAAVLEWFRPVLRAALIEEDAREAATPRNGKRVRVVKGRKVPIGTEGILGQVRASDYGKSKYGTWGRNRNCADLDPVDGGPRYRWVDVANCEVVDPASYRKSAEEIEGIVARATWQTALSYTRRLESPCPVVI